MRLQFRFLLLTLFALPAWATLSEVSFAQTYAQPPVGFVLGCSGVARGTFYASVSVTCSLPASDAPYNGALALTATAESGIGPLGIGVSTNTLDARITGDLSVDGVAEARSSWSDLVTPVGGVGAGFVQFHFFDQVGGNTTAGANFGGIQLCAYFCVAPTMIPIIFGDPYALSLISTDLSAFENQGAGELYVSSIDFFNAVGSPINGSLVVATPEPSSWILAFFPIAYFLRRFTRRGSARPGIH
jgi:hypothetical protein